MPCTLFSVVKRWPLIVSRGLKNLQNNSNRAAKNIFWPRNFGGRTAPKFGQTCQTVASQYFLTVYSILAGSVRTEIQCLVFWIWSNYMIFPSPFLPLKNTNTTMQIFVLYLAEIFLKLAGKPSWNLATVPPTSGPPMPCHFLHPPLLPMGYLLPLPQLLVESRPFNSLVGA